MKWSTIPVPVIPVPLVHYSAGMLWLAGTIEGGYDKQGWMLIWNRVNRLPQITLSLYLPRHIYFYPLMYPNVSVCMDSVEDDSGEKRKLQLFQSTGSWQGMYSSENAVSLSYGYACWLGTFLCWVTSLNNVRLTETNAHNTWLFFLWKQSMRRITCINWSQIRQ